MTFRNVRVTAYTVVMALALGACAREAEPEETVSWYRAHPQERKAMMTTCSDDPGRLGQTPNCINASQAEGLESIGSLRDLPPLDLSAPKDASKDEDRPKSRP